MDLENFHLFQFVAVGLLYNLYVSVFRNKKYWVWNFHLFLLQFVLKRFETSGSVDLENFHLFQCFETKLKHLGLYNNSIYGHIFLSRQFLLHPKSLGVQLFQKN